MALTETLPLFTVIIPTRHRNELLTRCLERLAPDAQTLSADRYEVYVTDDGQESTAASLVAERFPWATWVSGPCCGPAANRNSGARQGTASWLVFTDDDCVPGTGWLQGFADAITADGAKPLAIYEGRTTCVEGIRSPLYHAPINEEGGWLWSCNFAMHRERYAELGGFDEEFPYAHMEDVDFRERAHGRGLTMRFIPAAVVDHPARPDSLCEKIAPTHESEFMFYFKIGERDSLRMRQLRRIASVRIRKYLQHKAHPEAKILLRSLVIEIAYVLRHGGRWEKKYRDRYAGVQIPYPPGLAKRLNFR